MKPKRWKLVSVRREIVKFQLVSPYRTNERLLIWWIETPQGKRLHAELIGNSEETQVVDRLPQEKWQELYAGAQAAVAIIGQVPENYTKEII